MNDFATSLIGREVVIGGRLHPIVAVVVARGKLSDGNLLIHIEMADGSIQRKVFDTVRLAQPPKVAPLTETQAQGYIPRKGQLVGWTELDWDTAAVHDRRGFVRDFASIDPGGKILLTVEELILTTPDGKYGVDRLTLHAERVKTWIEPEDLEVKK